LNLKVNAMVTAWSGLFYFACASEPQKDSNTDLHFISPSRKTEILGQGVQLGCLPLLAQLTVAGLLIIPGFTVYRSFSNN